VILPHGICNLSDCRRAAKRHGRLEKTDLISCIAVPRSKSRQSSGNFAFAWSCCSAPPSDTLAFHDPSGDPCVMFKTSRGRSFTIVQDLPVGAVSVPQTSVISGEKKLPNLFVYAHLAQRGFHPGVRGGRSFFRPLFAGTAPILFFFFFFLTEVFFAAVLRSGCVRYSHKETIEDGNPEAKNGRASFHRLGSPSGRPQSSIYNWHTHIVISTRLFAQRVTRIYCWFQ